MQPKLLARVDKFSAIAVYKVCPRADYRDPDPAIFVEPSVLGFQETTP